MQKLEFIQIKRLFVISLFIALFLCSCNSETRTYKRVGGNHLLLKSENKSLFWFSGIHGNDPKNPMFRDIKNEFRNFEPSLVLVEGNADQNVPREETSAMKMGENVYVAFLAKKDNIECKTTEPTSMSLNNYLTDHYKKEDVLSMYVIRQMVQWKREGFGEASFNERLVSFANLINAEVQCYNHQISQIEISQLLEPHTKISRLDNSTWTGFDAKKYIYQSENVINEVWKKTSDYRNIYLINLIKEKLKHYDRIFIMMGFDHALAVKDELSEIIKNY